ncbi:MAG: O-antigen polymerase [Alphaproteobacteria bacterium]|nr:O-antigen polymerase [Alphaproteobacteria bacterium]
MAVTWWMKPHIAAVSVMVPVVSAAAYLSEDWYGLRGGAPKYLGHYTLAIIIFAVLAFALGAWLFARPTSHERVSAGESTAAGVIDRDILHIVFYAASCVTLLGYLLWFREFLGNPGLILPLLQGQKGAMYAAMQLAERIPGITSVVNLGLICFVLLASMERLTGERPRTMCYLLAAILLFFVVARVFLYSERMALLETLVPVVLIYIASARRGHRFFSLLPFIILPIFCLYFGLTEYFRSWPYFQETESSFAGFILSRLLVYYVTALNNGAGFFLTHGPAYVPVETAIWIWKFPVESVSELFRAILEPEEGAYSIFLMYRADPAFNNPSGIFAPFIDFGTGIGLLVWFGLGCVSGRLYHGFVRGQLGSCLLYPTWFIGILELPRIFYWGSPRYFPALLATLLVFYVLRAAGGSQARSDTRNTLVEQ